MKGLAILILYVVAISAVFGSDDVSEFAKAGPWSIRVDHTVGNGCFAFAQFEGGSVFRLGINKEQSSLYIVAGDLAWKSIEYGKKYKIAVQFGDEGQWEGNAKGFSFSESENQPFLWVDIGYENTDKFVKEFMEEKSVRLYYQQKQILHLSLRDSYRAANKLIECQEAVNSTLADPFASQKTSNDDPFEE